MLVEELEEFINEELHNSRELEQLCLSLYNKASDFTIGSGQPFQISYNQLFLQEFMRTPKRVAGYMMVRFHYMLVAQGATVIPIAVSGTPFANKEKSRNSGILKTIAKPFTASFDGDAWGEDGFLEWDSDHPLAPKHRIFARSKAEHYSYPIEVGVCPILTLWIRFCEWGGWVRWPYDQRIGIQAPSLKYRLFGNSQLTN